MAKRGQLFVISGPSGAGKSFIVKELLSRNLDLHLSVSCTTRKPREGEIDGVHYHFVDNDRFDELLASNAFYEWAQVHGNRYGTLRSVVAAEIDKGHDLILEIDVQGGGNVARENPDITTRIFVCPPSFANLSKRLADRKSETEQQRMTRMNGVARELAEGHNYDYVIIHEDWNKIPDAMQIATNEIASIIIAKRAAVPGNDIPADVAAKANEIAKQCETKGRLDFLDARRAEAQAELNQ